MPLELSALFDDTLRYKTEARLSIVAAIVFLHHLAQAVASLFRERNPELCNLRSAPLLKECARFRLSLH
jgi:hypothetical protein